KEDPPSDYDLPFWGGVVPVRMTFGEPEPDAHARDAGFTTPDHVRRR
ncbi:MAG: pyridoxamine 5'-phosphate oxidase family protein, partial [Micrococcales bacterium]|nr:pyridoxamine 5'-phosphate oxidase family protein [Micrococcales bacterium]